MNGSGPGPTKSRFTGEPTDIRVARARAVGSGAAILVLALTLAIPAASGTDRPDLDSAAGLTDAAHVLSATLQQGVSDDGDEIYVQQCAPCHGTEGEGGVAPSLQLSSLSAGDRFAVISEGDGEMPAFGPTLTRDEIQALTDVTGRFIGIGIYTGQCAPCHGDDGRGGVGPSLVTGALLPSETTEIITIGRSAMPGFGATLTDEQIALVASFVADLADEEAAGEAIYLAQCAPCHGADLAGGVGPSLLGMSVALEEEMSIVRAGRGAMPAFEPTLTNEQLLALETYLTSAAGGTSPAMVEAGARVYAESCASCHGTEREGGFGPALTTTTQSAAEMTTLVGEGQGSMPGFADTISSDDLAAVVSFLIDASTGDGPSADAATDDIDAAGLYAANCRACHGPNGEGGAGPPLAGTESPVGELTAVIADGRGSMPGFAGAFSEAELASVVEHMLTLNPDEAAAGGAPPDAASGKMLFAEFCSECHGAAGEGETGPTLAESRLAVNEIVVDVWSGHDADMPAFHEILTPDDILSVSSYAAGLSSAGAASDDDPNTRGWLTILLIAVAAVVLIGAATFALTRPRDRELPGEQT